MEVGGSEPWKASQQSYTDIHRLKLKRMNGSKRAARVGIHLGMLHLTQGPLDTHSQYIFSTWSRQVGDVVAN